MVLKYLIKDYPIQTLYFGIANIVANALVMLRYVGIDADGLMIVLSDVDAGANSTCQFDCSLGFAEYRGRLHLQPCIVRDALVRDLETRLGVSVFYARI